MPPTDVVELRPNRRSYLRSIAVVLPAVALYLVLRLSTGHGSWELRVGIAGGVLVLFALLLASYFQTARLWADAGTLHQRGFLGRRKDIGFERVASVLVVPHYRAVRTPPAPLLAFLDGSGRALVRIQGPMWNAADVERFATALDVHDVQRIDEPVRAADLRRDHGPALSYFDRHPVRFYLYSLVGTAVLIGVLLVVLLTLGVH